MAYSSSGSGGKNPWADDDDTWGTSSSTGGVKNRYVTSGGAGYSSSYGDIDDDDFVRSGPKSQYEQVQEQKQNSMNNQLDSTQRALASIYDSEAVGIATAEELVHQGEQLDNVERKTDKINQDMKSSQRHLNSIKSVFGGIKNWWTGEDKKKAEDDSKPPPTRQSKLQDTIDEAPDSVRRGGDHPGLRIKTDTSGFGEEDSEFGRPARSQGAYGGHREQVRSGFKDHDEQLDRNLEDMTQGMSRLKGLAVSLGDEIETQNEQVDRIMPKVERADIKVRDQNRQMGRILGK